MYVRYGNLYIKSPHKWVMSHHMVCPILGLKHRIMAHTMKSSFFNPFTVSELTELTKQVLLGLP